MIIDPRSKVSTHSAGFERAPVASADRSGTQFEDPNRRDVLEIAAGLAVSFGSSGFGSVPNGGAVMERVVGVGGFFFRSKDPKRLAEWYANNLGVTKTPSDYDSEAWRQEAGVTVFAPFEQNTEYFGDSRFQWMINFRVRNLDRMVSQLRARGISVEVDAETYPNGRFARIQDPEGNPVQPWEPAGKALP